MNASPSPTCARRTRAMSGPCAGFESSSFKAYSFNDGWLSFVTGPPTFAPEVGLCYSLLPKLQKGPWRELRQKMCTILCLPTGPNHWASIVSPIHIRFTAFTSLAKRENRASGIFSNSSRCIDSLLREWGAGLYPTVQGDATHTNKTRKTCHPLIHS